MKTRTGWIWKPSSGSLARRPDLAAAGKDSELLMMRLEAQGLDPALVRVLLPDTFHRLAHVCQLCQAKHRCERDLALEAAGNSRTGWERYCPNASALTGLSRGESGRPSPDRLRP